MIPELEFYRVVFYVMAGATGLFLLWIARQPSGKRRYFLPIPIICGTLSLAYFGMSIELLRFESATGAAIPLSRFVDYVIAWPIMLLVTGIVAGATGRQLAALIVANTITLSGTITAWFFSGPEALAGYGVTVVGYLCIAYLLVWPIAIRSGDQGGERVLLYGKLRNLLLLLWFLFLVLGISTRQGLGLLDAFSGVFLGSYLDIIQRIAFGVLLLRATDATDQIVAQIESDGSGGDRPGEGVEPPETITDAADEITVSPAAETDGGGTATREQ